MTRHVMPSIRKKVIERDMGCVYCGLPVATIVGEDAPYAKKWKAYDAKGKAFHFDHSTPHALGGANDETNIRLACEKCNLEKARKEASQIAASKGGAMLHSIKISEQVYQDLMEFQLPRETFSDVIERLITLRHLLDKAAPLIRGSAEFREWQEEKRAQEKAAHG